MTTGAVIFWVLSWAFVLGLMSYSFGRILRNPRHFDPDGIGPAVPPVPGEAEDGRR
ncbi:hypothetical protein BH20GEM2_BH20GEM2_04110 [soil metagenome]|jgi:hypothetical protein